MTTKDDLQNAFAGESQANRKYLAYAEQALADGYSQISRLLEAIAEAETIHAHAHLRTSGGVNSTEENLQAAIEGEHYEFSRMYPEFLERAEGEGNKQAARSFRYAMAAEKVHHALYQQALACVREGSDLPEAGVFLCPVCGHVHLGTPSANCPICGLVKDKYVEVK